MDGAVAHVLLATEAVMVGKVLIALSVLLSIVTIGWWIRDSIDYGKPLVLSKTARERVVIERDPLFGQEIKRLELEPGSWLGLFDAAPPFGAMPMCAVWIGLWLLGWRLLRRTHSVSHSTRINS